MDKAKELIAEYKAEHPGPLNLSLATTQDETNLTIAQFQKQWFEEAGVDTVTLDQLDQGNYIVAALLGNFQVFQWRNHSGVDMDQQYIWWHSSTALPVGELALNFGRHQGPGHRRGPRRQPRRDGPGQEAGLRRGGQPSASPTSATTSGAAGRRGRVLHEPTVHIEPKIVTPGRRRVGVRPARSRTCARPGSSSDDLSSPERLKRHPSVARNHGRVLLTNCR